MQKVYFNQNISLSELIPGLSRKPLSSASVSEPVSKTVSKTGVSSRLAARRMKYLLDNTIPKQAAPNTVWFGEEGSTELSLVGGKGASLSILQSVPGISVPEGFIVTTEVYRKFVESNPLLQSELAQLDALSDAWLNAMQRSGGAMNEETQKLEDAITRQCSVVKQRIAETAIPEKEILAAQYMALCEKMGEADLPVAVRSSATAEDLPNASFAGQHDTYLNQKGTAQMLPSIKNCWASLFHPHTVQYRNQLRRSLILETNDAGAGKGLRHGEVALAVVIQRTLKSSAAGVGFNVNPMGEAKIHIDANYGLGETVVSGVVNPDSWELTPDAKKILSSNLGGKEIKAVAMPEGQVESFPVPEMDRHRFVLNEQQVLQVAESVRTVGAFYQQKFGYKFIDTEFALDENGKLYFLQARPETVFSSANRVPIKGIPKEVQADLIFQGGSTGYPGAATGRLVYARTPEEAIVKIRTGDILVTSKTTPEWTIVFPKLGGIIVDIGGVVSHTALVGREHRIPTLLAAVDATKRLAEWDGKIVTIDSINSCLYEGEVKTVEGKVEDFVRPELQVAAREYFEEIHLIDEEGKWMCRPNMDISQMQIDFMQKAYDRASVLLDLEEPFHYKVIGNRLYIQVVDSEGHPAPFAKVTKQLLNWDLDRLEGLFDQRVHAVQELHELAERFEPTLEMLREYERIYQDWMVQLFFRGRFGHGALATLMQQNMNQIPDPAVLSSYLHLRYPMQNLSNEKEKEHLRIAQNLLELGFNTSDDPAIVRAKLQNEEPGLWREILRFSKDYEHITSDNMIELPATDAVLKQLLMTLEDKEFAFELPSLTPQQIAQMDFLFAQNPDLGRIMILAHKHIYQKENEHHIVTRAQFKIREKMLQYGQILVEEGFLAKAEDIFDGAIGKAIDDSQQIWIAMNESLAEKDQA